MISYLKGKIILKREKYIILESGGVGFKVFLSEKNLSKILQNGSILEIFCYTDIKEKRIELYGFLNFKELEFFEILEGIRGVGPKAALKISSLGSLDKIKEKILNQEDSLFDNIPGIGKKKAMTIILELTGKIKKEKTLLKKEDEEVLESLTSLGFSVKIAKEALLKISGDKSPEDKIKEALKILGKPV